MRIGAGCMEKNSISLFRFFPVKNVVHKSRTGSHKKKTQEKRCARELERRLIMCKEIKHVRHQWWSNDGRNAYY